MKTSEQLNKVLPKLAAALKVLGTVKKSSDNPFFRSKYANLNDHITVVEEALEKQGLILLQPVSRDERGSYVESIVVEPESGQFVSSQMDLVLSKQNMQDAGSAVTYARRYTLGALLSMQALDDDGEASVGRGKAGTSQTTIASSSSTTLDVKPKSSFRTSKAKAENIEASSSNGQGDTSQVQGDWS